MHFQLVFLEMCLLSVAGACAVAASYLHWFRRAYPRLRPMPLLPLRQAGRVVWALLLSLIAGMAAAFATCSNFNLWTLRSSLLRRFIRYPQTPISASIIRAAMKAFKPLEIAGDDDGNPHSYDAKIRKRAAALANRIFPRLFFIQRSSRDPQGTSEVHDPVDLNVSPQGNIHRAEALSFVDVDYYVNMPYYFSLMKPMAIYGMEPSGIPSTRDCHQAYIKDNMVHWDAHMGYKAKHYLWNYGGDYVDATWWGSVYHYRVFKYHFPSDRSLTVLLPVCKVPWFARLFADPSRHRLARYKLTFSGSSNNWTAYRHFDQDGSINVTIAADGPDSQASTVKYPTFCKLIDSSRVLLENRLPEFTVHKALTSDETYNMLWTRYAVDYLRYGHVLENVHTGLGYSDNEKGSKGDCPCANHVQAASIDCSTHYKVGEHDNNLPSKSTITKVAEPIIALGSVETVGRAPIRDHQAAVQAQQERIVEVQKEAAARVDPAIRALFGPFVDALFLRLGTPRDPLKFEEWIERVRPEYREAYTAEQYNEIVGGPGRMERQATQFIKSEAYNEIKAPRLITPLPLVVQAQLFPYAYALQDLLHTQKWFAFGKPLPVVADYIAQISANPQKIALETDFSRYDGTFTEVMRELELAIYLRAFPEHEAQIRLVHSHTYDLDAAVLGAKCNTGYSRASGAADTCLMNTLCNLFTRYVAYGDHCFNSCVTGGDDGLCFEFPDDVDLLAPAVEKCGFKIKVIKVPFGKPFTFLGRTFCAGDRNSCCDPKRLLPKLHIAGHPNIPLKYRKARYAMKIQSLMESDSKTPVVGELLRSEKIFTKVQVAKEYLQDDRWRALVQGDGGPWPNEVRPWMSDYIAERVTLIRCDTGRLLAELKPTDKQIEEVKKNGQPQVTSVPQARGKLAIVRRSETDRVVPPVRE